MDGRKSRLKRKKRSSGETLVETIVSFLVLVLAMTAVTMMVRFAITMKQQAQERIAALELSAAEVETGAAENAAGTEAAALNIRIGGGDIVSLPVDVSESGVLRCFAPEADDGE